MFFSATVVDDNALGSDSGMQARTIFPFSMSHLAMGLFVLGLPLSGWSQTFNHPGIMNDRRELDFIKQQIATGNQPWKDAFTQVQSSQFASLSYTPKPRADVDCGAYSTPDNGCSDEKNDVLAAYTQALMWYMTGNSAYAQKSIQIMNAWSAVVKTHTNSNAPLESAWGASVFPRAAEIIRYTYSGWAAADVARFSTMLDSAYLPYIKNGSPAHTGNWELSMIEAMTGIAVFTDDHALFDKAVSMWRLRVPAYFYLTTDGQTPVPPPGGQHNSDLISYWFNQSTFVDGLAQETCRDFGHTQYGIAATINAAETMLHQGVNVYDEQKKRLTATLEFHAGYLLHTPVPKWLCGGSLSLSVNPIWEIAYNHYHNRDSVSLPNTLKLITNSVRPSGTDHMAAWETLTHADLGAIGVSTTGLNMLMNSSRPSRTPLKIVFAKTGQIQLVIPVSGTRRVLTYNVHGELLPSSSNP